MKRISMLCCTILALLLLSFMPNVYAEEVEERKQETVPISENTTDYIVKVYDGEEEVAHMQLPEETDLQEYFDFLIQEREILGKTFVGFKEILEDETYSEDYITTTPTRDINLAMIFTVNVHIGNEASVDFTLAEGDTLADLSLEDQEALEVYKDLENPYKDFYHFIDEDGNVILNDTPITHNITLIPVFTVDVVIDGTLFTIEENKTLADLNLTAYKEVKDKRFLRFEDEYKNTIKEDTPITQHINIIAVYEDVLIENPETIDNAFMYAVLIVIGVVVITAAAIILSKK